MRPRGSQYVGPRRSRRRGKEGEGGHHAVRRLWAPAGLDAADPVGRQRAAPGQKLGILAGIDVIGDRGDLPAFAHPLAQPIHQRSFARSDRTADPDPRRIPVCLCGHERNSLVYWVSGAMEASSTATAAPPKEAESRAAASAAAVLTTGASAARMRWPSV